jgi:hypothetical protein
MALYLKTQESSDEIGRIISGLVRRIKNIKIIEPKNLEITGKYVASVEIEGNPLDIVVQDNLTKEAKELLVEKIGYERDMNIWFYRRGGSEKGCCFPKTKFEKEFTKYIGNFLIEKQKADKVTLAIPNERIKSEKNLYKIADGKEIVDIGNLRGITEDYDFEHFHA